MRRLAILFAGGAVWLFLAAIPALADGGPHVASINNGSSGINADSCAGCHRAHTAQGSMLLVTDEADLCLTCHGTTGTGATTDVEDGIQFTLASGLRGGTVLGALRNGGFAEARIGSAQAYSVGYLRSATAVSWRTKVPVLASGQPVTSAHIPGIAGLTGGGTAWGNGAFSATANPGAAMTLECTSCHNPHGNGNYRILNPIPSDDAGPLVEATTGVNVTDAPLPPQGDTRNYTVIQAKGTQGTPSTYLLYASQVISGGYSDTAGDYLHRTVPWDPQVAYDVFPAPANTTANDAPNGQPATVGTQIAFNFQINAWCATCHTRYATTDINGATTVVQDLNVPGTEASYNTSSGDAIFTYRHPTSSNKPCTTCHVAHGSNAQMTGTFTVNETYPGGSTPTGTDSRLLKIDNRGTCQACHDPTGILPAGTVRPTGAAAPVPYVP